MSYGFLYVHHVKNSIARSEQRCVLAQKIKTPHPNVTVTDKARGINKTFEQYAVYFPCISVHLVRMPDNSKFL